jgi:hypothetical protein
VSVFVCCCYSYYCYYYIIFLILNLTFLSYFVVVKGKGKVYPRTPSLTWEIGGVGGQRHASAALLLEKNPSSHWLRGRVGPKAGLEA